MKTSQDGINLIKYFEGFRTKAYQDSVGVWTIGYGTTKGIKEGMIITESKAEEWLARDIAYFENKVSELVKIPLRQNEFDALISFTYNLGEGNLKKSTLLKKLNNVSYTNPLLMAEVADEFLKWNKAGGKVLAGLTKRRMAEREMFLRPIKIQDEIAKIDKLSTPKGLDKVK